MTRLAAHRVFDDEDESRTIAVVHPAAEKSVRYVLRQKIDSEDGRSNWMWVRLPNGDLILGVYPQGNTYFAMEADAIPPGDI